MCGRVDDGGRSYLRGRSTQLIFKRFEEGCFLVTEQSVLAYIGLHLPIDNLDYERSTNPMQGSQPVFLCGHSSLSTIKSHFKMRIETPYLGHAIQMSHLQVMLLVLGLLGDSTGLLYSSSLIISNYGWK